MNYKGITGLKAEYIAFYAMPIAFFEKCKDNYLHMNSEQLARQD